MMAQHVNIQRRRIETKERPARHMSLSVCQHGQTDHDRYLCSSRRLQDNLLLSLARHVPSRHILHKRLQPRLYIASQVHHLFQLRLGSVYFPQLAPIESIRTPQ